MNTLGPNQLAQLRKTMPIFKLMEKTTLERLKERAENRKQFEKELKQHADVQTQTTIQ